MNTPDDRYKVTMAAWFPSIEDCNNMTNVVFVDTPPIEFGSIEPVRFMGFEFVQQPREEDL